jgi:hypothetical protein
MSTFTFQIYFESGCNFGVGDFFQQNVGFLFRLPSQTVYNNWFYNENSFEFIRFTTNKLKQPITFLMLCIFLEEKFPVTQIS